MSRERVLEKVIAAVPGGDPDGQQPEDLPRAVLPGDPISLFLERSRQLGVEVEVVSSEEAAAEAASAWCSRYEVSSVIAWRSNEIASLVDRLRSDGIRVLAEDAGLDQMAQADAGVTAAEWAVAETGTLVLPAAPGQPRLVSVLPFAHLAVLRSERIIPDLAALFARCGPMPSALTLISGPSRSADIGLQPVLGAHGPGVVGVIVIRQT